MKNKRYSNAQIMGILKQAESGVPRTWNEQCQLLQMACEVWWHGSVDDLGDEGDCKAICREAHLLRTGVEPADQAEKAVETG